MKQTMWFSPDSKALLFLKNAVFTLVVPGVVAVYLPLMLAVPAPDDLLVQLTPGRTIALVPLVGGVALYFWCLWEFVAYGSGTPAPFDAPKRLVVRGPYRWVRNPMYLGVELVILGWSAWFQSLYLLLYAGCAGLMFYGFVMVYEEPTLRRQFGIGYDQYRERVGCWLPVWKQESGIRDRNR